MMDVYQELLDKCVSEGAETIVPRLPEEERISKHWLCSLYPREEVWVFMRKYRAMKP